MIIRFFNLEFQPTRLNAICVVCKAAISTLRYEVSGVTDSEQAVIELGGFCCLPCSQTLLGEMLKADHAAKPRVLVH